MGFNDPVKLKAWHQRRADLFLFLLALALYLPGITWGLPNATGPDRVRTWTYDDRAPLAALTEVYHTVVSDATDRWVAYPLLHDMVLVALYSPYLGWLMLSGQCGKLSSVYPFGLADPVTDFRVLTLIARAASVGMAAGIVWAAYRIGHTLWDSRTGVLAAVVSLLLYPMFYYSKTANLEVPYLFWTGLGLLVYARILARGITLGRAALLGIFAGLAVATKDQAVGVFLLLPLFLIPRHGRDWRAGKVSWWGRPLAFFTGSAAVYALGSGLILEPDRYFAHVRWLLDSSGGRLLHAGKFVEWYPFTLSGMAGLTGEVVRVQSWFLGPLLLASALLAMVLAARQRRPELAFALPALSYLCIVILPTRHLYLRNALPIALVLGLFSARGVALGLRYAGRSRVVTALGLTLVFAWPFCLSADLVFQLLNDSRYAAEEWLAAHMGEGDRIAYFGDDNQLPRLRADVQILQVPAGPAAADYLKQHRPEYVTVIPDWMIPAGEQWEHSSCCPEDLYRRLHDGSLGYVLAAKFQTNSLVKRQLLDYPSVNPPVRIFVRTERPGT